MKTCFACHREVADADRFCGHCGAVQAIPAADVELSGEPDEAPSEAQERGAGRRGGIAVLLVVAVLGALALLAYASFFRDAESSVLRFALDGIGGPDDEAATDAPVEDPTDQPDETEEVPAADAQSALATGPDGAILLQPGNWQFTTQLVGVSKANPADNFEISRQGIGSSEAHSICVTRAIADDPRGIAFPFQPGLSCSPGGFAMSNGSYRSNLTCSFPQFGGRRPVTASGSYSRSNVSLDVNVRVPAQVVRGDFAQPPEIVMQYRINGYLTGPC